LRFAFAYDFLSALLVVGFGYGLQLVSLMLSLVIIAFGWLGLL
jgi:hypothetical protein